MTFKVAVKKTSRYDVTGEGVCPEMQMHAALNIRHEMSPYTSTQRKRHFWQKERREVFCYHTAVFLSLNQTITVNHSAK